MYKDYKDYQKGFDVLSNKQYGKRLNALLSNEKNEEEMNFVRRYRKYSPVIETDCVMNRVCKNVEKIENDIKWNKIKKNVLVEYADLSKIDLKLLDKLYVQLKMYNSRKSVRGLQVLAENESLNGDDMNDMFKAILYTHKDKVRDDIFGIFNDNNQAFNHLVYISLFYNMSIDVVWEVMGDYIVECIPWGETYVASLDIDGVEYLGSQIGIREVAS